MTKELNNYPTLTVREDSPDGTAWIQILEEPGKSGKIHRIFFQIGKAGSSINSYCYAMAELATELLRNGYSISELINLLLDITSDRTPRLSSDGPINRSGAEALAAALREYLKSIEPSENERRPARLTKI